MNYLPKLFSFKGRTGRIEFWLVFIISVAIIAGLNFFSKPLLDKILSEWMAVIAINAMIIPVYWILIATEVRRFHDLGRSGYWVLIILIPYAGQVIALIWLGFISGDNYDNEYGTKLPDKASLT
jgi:uncharacterized membrane protein YhaH (DUF805 family)